MNWAIVIDNADIFIQGTILTVIISVSTIVLSVVLAFPLAVMRDLPIPPLRIAVAAYSWMTRAIPALTLLFLAYYGLPQFGIFLDPVPAAILGLTVSAVGYNMEYIRAGILAVPATQYEACKSLGMPLGMTLRRVIIPQAMRTILPPLTSNLTLLVKGSSLASLVAVSELTGQGSALISFTYQPVPILITVAAIYLMLNTVVVSLQAMIERRYTIA